MAILPIVTYGHRSLRQEAKPVEKNEAIHELVENMFETMRNAHGIGLAGNQVDILKQIIVVDVSELDDYKDQKPLVLINPEIVSREGEWEMEEGCLSIPIVRDVVTRAEKIRVRYKDVYFNDVELEADKILGRVILHEIDHLNGILFIDHLPPGRRKFHKGLLLDIKRGELEIPYPVITGMEHTL
jgi:peptide deformylase